MRQPKFNRERMLQVVENGLSEGEGRDEDDLTSDERETTQEPLQDPARESEPSPPPAQPAASAPVTSDEFDYKASYRELLEMNKQLMGTVNQLAQQKVSTSPETRDRGFTGQPPAPSVPPPRNADDLALYGDFEPIMQELHQVKQYTNLFVSNEQERVEQDAQAAFNRLRAKHEDAESLIDPQLFHNAIQGAKQRASEALKQGKRFTFDWDKNLQAEYDTADAPRLRSREQKRLDEQAAKTKQQEELQKVSGMPSGGARYQSTEESNKGKRTELKAGQTWQNRLRDSVTKRLGGMQE